MRRSSRWRLLRCAMLAQTKSNRRATAKPFAQRTASRSPATNRSRFPFRLRRAIVCDATLPKWITQHGLAFVSLGVGFIYRRLNALSSETLAGRGLLARLPVGSIRSERKGLQARQSGDGDGKKVIGQIEG